MRSASESRRSTLNFAGPIRKSEGATKGSKNIIVLIRKTLEEKVIVKGPGGTHSMSKFEAALMQQANKAASGDIRAFREVLRLREKVQEQGRISTLRSLWSTLLKLLMEDPLMRRTRKNDKEGARAPGRNRIGYRSSLNCKSTAAEHPELRSPLGLLHSQSDSCDMLHRAGTGRHGDGIVLLS